LGQHFLHDPKILEAIVRAAEVSRSDTVLEVGTGLGSLTRLLCDRAKRVVSLEVDRDLLAFTRQELAGAEDLELLHADALAGKSSLAPVVAERLAATKNVKLVANLPYNIATPFILALFRDCSEVDLAVVLLQKELALRLSAPPGSRASGPASLLLGFWAEVELLQDIPAGAFQPPPRVASKLIRIRRRPQPVADIELYEAFSQWVRALFRERRKQIGGLLRRFLGAETAAQALQSMELRSQLRVESLSIEAFVRLAREHPEAKFF
jgi:16S rRNA (adenine1518-N6/adenine1519-N6)-dimethyltransferase